MNDLPDTSGWLPRHDAAATLKNIFFKRCSHAEEMIVTRLKQEKEYNIDNFESGISIEEIVREELSDLLPDRYFVTRGVINDRNGLTSGDNDIVIFNKNWFPILKSEPTDKSRKPHFPIEGVYAIGEVKQTLSFDSLDAAMKKLVINKRLLRGCLEMDK